jgi:hypothetical protein
MEGEMQSRWKKGLMGPRCAHVGSHAHAIQIKMRRLKAAGTLEM